MPAPASFYYSESQSSINYSRIPSGILSIPQLIRNQPCWVQPTQSRSKKPKTLLLADWTESKWTDQRIIEIKKILKELISEGFKIYRWHSGKACLLEIDSLSSLKNSESVIRTSNEEMIQSLTNNYQIPSEQVQILDNYWLDHLASHSEELPLRTLSFSELTNLSEPATLKSLINKLLTATPPLSHIVLDDFSYKANNTAQFLEKNYPNIQINVQYTSVTLTSKEVQSYPHDMVNDQLRLKKENLIDIKTIDFKGEISPDVISKILNDAPNLTKITLNPLARINEPLKIDEQRLLYLREIVIIVIFENSTESLINILKSFPYLKKISLNLSTDLNPPLTLDEKSLPYLEKIDITSLPTFGTESVRALLKAAPNLKKISLYKLTISNELFTRDEKSLVYLESIDITHSTISVENLISLLITAPNLKKISLHCLKFSNEPFTLPELSLLYLEEISLSSAISNEKLGTLLKAAPNLKKISLVNTSISDEAFTLPEVSLLCLEEIFVSGTISTERLRIVLKAAPNLKKISLKYTHVSNEAFPFSELSLLYLEKIDVTQSKVSAENLISLLKAAPNLKKIDLTGNQILKSDNQILLYLQKIDVTIIDDSFSGSKYISKGSHPVKELLSNPIHDPKKMKTFEPKQNPFKFTLQNHGVKNQNLIIQKLSQYLTLTDKHIDLISKIQNGICIALSHYFLSMQTLDWEAWIKVLQEWDAQTIPKEALCQHFDTLCEYIKSYQLKSQNSYYLGDNLSSFIHQYSSEPHIFYNPWHAIAVRKKDHEKWEFYDPNFVTGFIEISEVQLIEKIHESLGTLISIKTPCECKIINPDAFIESGGLLCLCICSNIEEMLAKIPEDYPYSNEALDGLLLRDTSGEPAWLHGLNSRNKTVTNLTQQLLYKFEALYPDAAEQLSKSTEALTKIKRQECLTTLTQKMPLLSNTGALMRAIRGQDHSQYFDERLRTWSKIIEAMPSTLSYCHDCLTHSGFKKRLIELDSTAHLDLLRLQLEKQAKSVHRPVFYIDKPDDLICQAPWIKEHPDHTGELKHGPGGPLFDFLQENKDNQPLLIINYDNFHADDIVRFNALIDKDHPHADGTPLPEGTRVIGLINPNKEGAYQGSDFYSRFNKTEQCPLKSQQFAACDPLRSVLKIAESTSDECTIINLYHTKDWRERLLGSWILDGNVLKFEEGLLNQAIQKGLPIEIQNGLWGDESFQQFWQQILSTGVRQGERSIRIPEEIRVTRPETETYTWSYIPAITNILSTDAHAFVLNPGCLEDYFGRYVIHHQQLIKQPGWIEAAKGTTLIVNVTRTLTDDTWAMLLSRCKEHQVTLEIHCAPEVELPEAFHYSATTAMSRHALPPETHQEDAVIISTEPDTTLALLTQKKAAIVIDVSECKPENLLMTLDGKLNPDSLLFEFAPIPGALTTALENNEHIILTGHFSPELLDALSLLLQQRQLGNPTGQLTLITKDKNAISHAKYRYTHEVHLEDKWACLPVADEMKTMLAPFVENESLSQLKARCHFLTQHPEKNSDEAWLGLKHLPMTHTADILDDPTLFTAERIRKINEALVRSPFVLITGATGVGKSTFIEHEFCGPNDTLYLSENKIQEWASDCTQKRKILFIDEANLSIHQWSEFESLFSTPPTLLTHGQLYRLDAHHKVVFASNPLSYGDERKLAPLFEHHGNTVLFTPLPQSVIQEKVLAPLFENTTCDNALIIEKILTVYTFICQCSTDKILITPRELQMMALLIIMHTQQHPEQDINLTIQHFIYALAKNLIPDEHQITFDQQFKPKHTLPFTTKNIDESTYITTSSRQTLTQQIDDFLNLREWRRQSTLRSSTQKTAGLGGIIIRPLRKLSFTQFHVVNCGNKIKSQTKTFSPIAVSV